MGITQDILTKSKGIKVKNTSEVIQDTRLVREKDDKVKAPTVLITKGDKLEAVAAGLIPNAFINCDFNETAIKENQINQMRASARRFKVVDFDKYMAVTNGLISTFISNKLPNQSYLIGAPNGFGKTSFVYSCLLKLFKQGRLCTPYISLTDLAQVKASNERSLLRGITSNEYYCNERIEAHFGEEYMEAFYADYGLPTYTKKPITLIDKFSWSEYMNSDVLFCYFTDVGSKVLESEIFKTAITIRGTKGLPTIATISSSLDPYKRDVKLAEMVWNEILTYNSKKPSYDRVLHVSCWKNYSVPLKSTE